MLLWRVSNHATLDGRGGLMASARWHTAGRPIVYFSESPAAALLESLVHLELDPAHLPRAFRLLKAEAPDGIGIGTFPAAELPHNWISNEMATQALGDEWLADLRTPLLRVPSALVPETHNVLFNPKHADAARVRVLWHAQHPWDVRILRR